MLFVSYEFIFVFLPITWFVWYISCRYCKTQLALFLLTISSFVFYSYWNPPFIFLLLISIAVNFISGSLIINSKNETVRYIVLFIGLLFNITAFAYFKYFNFLMENLLFLFSMKWQPIYIFLPLGISFFSLQQIAWLVDVYKNKNFNINTVGISLKQRIINYALFISFFPQLIAGPIVSYKRVFPQLKDEKIFIFNWQNIFSGLSLFSIGMFKKTILADLLLLPYVSHIFNNSTETFTIIEIWTGVIGFYLQLYFDLSGYADMAVGLGKLFNIDIPLNFNSPIKATSMIGFWQRWHITLTYFLTNYIYIPLVGNYRKTRNNIRKYLALFVTMFICGFWHGANWTYILVWICSGICVSINHLWRRYKLHMSMTLGWCLTFFIVSLHLVFYRATTVSQGLDIFMNCFALDKSFLFSNKIPISFVEVFTYQNYVVIKSMVLFLLLSITLLFPNSNEIIDKYFIKNNYKWYITLGIALMFIVSVGMLTEVSEFLYFQF